MNLLRPRSLRLQAISAMLLGLVLSHMIAIGIYSGDRGDAITRTEAQDMVERIAGTVILMSELDPAVRAEVARASQTTEFTVSVADGPTIRSEPSQHPVSMDLEPYLRSLLPDFRNALFVSESDSSTRTPSLYFAHLGRKLLRLLDPRRGDEAVSVHKLRSSVLLNSGEWLNFR